MKTIYNLRDLEDYGVFPLTGEACGLMMRTLCDYSENGKAAIEKWLGTRLLNQEPWNSSTRGQAHVGCIMLAPEAYLSLGVFCLLDSGCRYVYRVQPAQPTQADHVKGIVVDHALYGFVPGEESEHDQWLDMLRRCGRDTNRRYGYAGTAPGGDRHTHAMSGRVT